MSVSSALFCDNEFFEYLTDHPLRGSSLFPCEKDNGIDLINIKDISEDEKDINYLHMAKKIAFFVQTHFEVDNPFEKIHSNPILVDNIRYFYDVMKEYVEDTTIQGQIDVVFSKIFDLTLPNHPLDDHAFLEHLMNTDLRKQSVIPFIGQQGILMNEIPEEESIILIRRFTRVAEKLEFLVENCIDEETLAGQKFQNCTLYLNLNHIQTRMRSALKSEEHKQKIDQNFDPIMTRMANLLDPNPWINTLEGYLSKK